MKRHESFHLALSNYSLERSQPPCFKDTHHIFREKNHLARGWCFLPTAHKEVRPPTNDHVSELSWKQILQSPQMTVALATNFTATAWKTLSNNHPAKLIPDSWTAESGIKVYSCSKLLNYGAISYTAKDNKYHHCLYSSIPFSPVSTHLIWGLFHSQEDRGRNTSSQHWLHMDFTWEALKNMHTWFPNPEILIHRSGIWPRHQDWVKVITLKQYANWFHMRLGANVSCQTFTSFLK